MRSVIFSDHHYYTLEIMRAFVWHSLTMEDWNFATPPRALYTHYIGAYTPNHSCLIRNQSWSFIVFIRCSAFSYVSPLLSHRCGIVHQLLLNGCSPCLLHACIHWIKIEILPSDWIEKVAWFGGINEISLLFFFIFPNFLLFCMQLLKIH